MKIVIFRKLTIWEKPDDGVGPSKMQFVLFRHEILTSFYSWRGTAWIISSGFVFSLIAYLLLTDKELSLLDQGEMLFTLAEVILSLGMLMSAVNASSTISSETESGTFESLLLTPLTNKQIIFQKMLSIITMWVIQYLVSIPYLIAVSSGTNLSVSAVLYVGLYGTLLVSAITSLSIALSWKLKNSKNSIMTSLMIVLLLLTPSLFFGTSLKKTDFGAALGDINPFSNAADSLDSILVDNEQFLFQQIQHIWPVTGFLIICTVVLITSTRRLEIKNEK
jgi:ABC-2 type transport system permease protein